MLHLPRRPFDVGLAVAQHAAYRVALESAGIRVTLLPAEPTLPDAVFVEDAAVVLEEVAVICAMGAPSRRPEIEGIAQALAGERPLRRIQSPGTLEGGDVLRAGRRLFVGLSSRTNLEGILQFAEITQPFGYRVQPVSVRRCLHLKTACTLVGDRLILVNHDWVDPFPFAGFELLATPPDEPWGANTLTVNGRVFVAASSPKTADLLRAKGCDVNALDISELQKAEAGLTCLSVLY